MTWFYDVIADITAQKGSVSNFIAPVLCQHLKLYFWPSNQIDFYCKCITVNRIIVCSNQVESDQEYSFNAYHIIESPTSSQSNQTQPLSSPTACQSLRWQPSQRQSHSKWKQDRNKAADITISLWITTQTNRNTTNIFIYKTLPNQISMNI